VVPAEKTVKSISLEITPHIAYFGSPSPVPDEVQFFDWHVKKYIRRLLTRNRASFSGRVAEAFVQPGSGVIRIKLEGGEYETYEISKIELEVQLK
jgi:hypothetical protein